MLFGGNFSEEIGLWKEGEKRECRFVFIGRNLDHEALEKGLMDCKAEELRFREGDIVYANVGHFTRGIILKCWIKGIHTELRYKTRKKPMFGFQSTIMTMLCQRD